MANRLTRIYTRTGDDGTTGLADHHATQLEQWLDEENDTPPALVVLAQLETVSMPGRHYLNRLSDLLFVLCRVLNRHLGVADVYWKKGL
jgi:cob(I)alamin adenosyltransferase